MAVMIPSSPGPELNSSAEKHIFEWFKSAGGTEDWVILHSLGISSHQKVIHGETDFLVLAPGLGMFALEVKGGRVRRQMGKWQFIDRYGNYDERIRGPFDQAWEGIYSIKKAIEIRLDSSHQYLSKLLFGIGVMFPDIEYRSVGVDEESWQVFDITDGKDVFKFVKRLSEGALNTRKRLGYSISEIVLPSKGDVNYLAELLRGDFDKDIPLKIKQKYADESFLILTKEQARCIEQLSDNPRALIRGTAGTGKTLLAIEAAKRAVISGEKVALFCFNKFLGEWLQNIFIEIPANQRPEYVGTFHGYLKYILQQQGLSTENPNQEHTESEYFQDILPALTVHGLKKLRSKYDRIIVDEAQDLLIDNYLNVMDASLNGGLAYGKWVMFGDLSMQAIYQDGLSEYDYINLLQSRAFFAIFRLTRNCRNTRKICIDIENIVGIPENAAFEDTFDTPAVDHIVFTDKEDQKNKLLSLIDSLIKKNIKKSDIVILSPYVRKKSIVADLSQLEIEDYSIHSSGKIRFSTIQAMKGLESSTVILVDIDNYIDQKLIYVGLSRARFDLHVLESIKAFNERNHLFFKRRLANGI